MRHVMGPSRLNHGNRQCVNCHATDLEINVLGDECPSGKVRGVHTEGPYFVAADDAEDCEAHANSGLALIDTGREGDWPIARLMEWHNAKRVHACLTACDGIADPAALREQRDELLRNVQMLDEAHGVIAAQRDELLAACEMALPLVEEACRRLWHPVQDGSDASDGLRALRAAIAKVSP